MSPQGVYPTADVCAIGDEISSTYEGRHITLYAENLEHGSAVSYVTKGYPVWQNNLVGVAFNSQAAGENPLIAVDTEGIWCQDVKGENDAGDVAIAPGDALYINTTTGLISGITDESTQLPFGYALGNVALGEIERIAVKVHWNPLTPEILAVANGKVAFNDWGAVIEGGYYLYMNDDYSAYVASLDSGHLDLSGNTAIDMIVSVVGEVFTIEATFCTIYPETNFPQGIIFGGTGRMQLYITDVDSAREGDIWYSAALDKIRFRTAAGVETVTSV